jgi:hypothetical protein
MNGLRVSKVVITVVIRRVSQRVIRVGMRWEKLRVITMVISRVSL